MAFSKKRRRLRKMMFGRRARTIRKRLRRVSRRSGLKSYGGIVR